MGTWDEYKKTMELPAILTRAAKENDLAALTTLIAEGHDINIRDPRGYTPLMLAAYNGNIEALSFLIQKGANLNLGDFAGNTPLMGTSFKGNLEVARMLLDGGADLNAKNLAGMDAYDFASTFGRANLTQYFNERGIKKRKIQRIKLFWKLCVQHLLQKIKTKK